MNGADALVQTLVVNGIDTFFANPGTSEMHLVAAIERNPKCRGILCLFEGVATGAADGFARVAGRPAATLLHLGPGFANAAANLHNARRARSPVINIIGDHATYHRNLDAPLTSDIATACAPFSVWVGEALTAADTVERTLEALSAAQSDASGPVSLILPADAAWTDLVDPQGAKAAHKESPLAVTSSEIDNAADAITKATKVVVLIGGKALHGAGLISAARLADSGYRVLAETFPAVQERGAGCFNPPRMQYFAEMALADLAGVDLLVLVEVSEPVAFFAYPNIPGSLVPVGALCMTLATPGSDGSGALAALADALECPGAPDFPQYVELPMPTGALNAATVGQSIARHMPENSIVAEDAVTSRVPALLTTQNARRHRWLSLTGGAIGQALPNAIGAAVAEPSQKIVCLTGDGAAMYTNQALWTMARENVDVTIVVFANHAYKILKIELARTGADASEQAAANLLGMENPRIDWVALATAFGVRAVRALSAEEFDTHFASSMEQRGPMLIVAEIA